MQYKVGQKYRSPCGRYTVTIMGITERGVTLKDPTRTDILNIAWRHLTWLSDYQLVTGYVPGQIWNGITSGDAYHIASVSEPELLIRYWDETAQKYKVGKKLPEDSTLAVPVRTPGLFDTFQHRITKKLFEIHEVDGDAITLVDADTRVRYCFDNGDGQIYRELQFYKSGLHRPLRNNPSQFWNRFDMGAPLGHMIRGKSADTIILDFADDKKIRHGNNYRTKLDLPVIRKKFSMFRNNTGFLSAHLSNSIRKLKDTEIGARSSAPVVREIFGEARKSPSLFPQVGDRYICRTTGWLFEVLSVNGFTVTLQGFVNVTCPFSDLAKRYHYFYSEKV